jgi:AbrB family looped-hinge helix DNA binding protein
MRNSRHKLSHVKVKRKGQVTIPVELRRKFNIREGSLLEVRELEKGILFKSVPPVKAGDVVGKKTYDRIIRELDESRRKQWR